MPAIRYGIGLSLGRAESVPRRISQGRKLSRGRGAPSPKHLASWVGACPGKEESAGVTYSHR